MQRAKWACALLLVVAPTLHALDVSYGSFLTITGIVRTDDKIVLPVERKKYYNLRILNQGTYQFVKTCQNPCVQEVKDVDVTISRVRAAKERANMWIVTGAFNQDWQGTFLVFRQGDTYQVKHPANLVFLQPALKKQTEEKVLQAVKDTL